MTGEDDTWRTLKTMLSELSIDPNFPSHESYFEVDQRGKNGREKREEGRISERGCERGDRGDTGKHNEHREKHNQGTNFHQKQHVCLFS